MKRVKTRAYNSPRRREQAAATRAAILEAAQLRFERDGYAGTTMAAIAHEAGVALKTVYLAFETKSGLLRALWNRLLRGDRDDVPVAAQQWYREAVEEPDPVRQLRLNARNSRERKLRMGSILTVIRSGALVDPDVAALWQRIESEYHANQGVIVKSLAEKKALRTGLDAGRATDTLWAVNHPALWQLLVDERDWTPEDYERWTAEVACQQLLNRAPQSRRSSRP